MNSDRGGGAQASATASRRATPAAIAAALLALSSSLSFAAAASDPHYDVAPGCPSRAAFGEALRARLPATLRAYALANNLAVSIRRERAEGSGADRYTGELGALAAALPGEGRSVQGASCAEVIEALTLIAALSVEQLASEPREAGREVVAADVSAAEPPGLAPSPPARRGPSLGPVAFLWWQNAPMPRFSPGIGLGLVASWAEHPAQPWLMAGAYWSTAELERAGSARARFEHASSYAVACVGRLPLTGPIAVRPCVDVDVGALRGEGQQVGGARRRTSLWLSVGLEARASLFLAERFELGAQLGSVFPLWRPRFYFLPGVTAFEVDPVGLRGGTFASVLF